jgi:WD40 repeat protein
VVATAISAGLAVRATRAETDARLSERMQLQLRRQAELEREKAQAQAAAARLNEYVADINLAQQSLDLGNYGRAVQLLKKHLPQRGTADLRGFEWRYLWRLSYGDDHAAFPGQGASVRTLAISPNGRWLAVGTDDRLNLWDLPSGALARTLPVRQISAVFCGEGRELVVSTPSEVRVLDLSNRTEQNLPEQDGGSLAVSKDGTHLAVSGRESVKIWGTKGWIKQDTLAGAFAPMAFSPDGQLLASATRDGITIWDLAAAKAKVVLQNSSNFFQPRGWDQLGRVMVFAADGLQLIAPRNRPFDSGGFRLNAWNVLSGEPCQLLGQDPQRVEHTGTIAWLAVSPDGNTLATASMDHSIRVWDLQSPQEPTVLHGHLSEVWTIAFSPDGGTLISGAKDGSVNLWSIPVPDKQDLLKGPYALEGFSTDGQRMAVLDQQRGALLWMNPVTRQAQDELILGSGWMRRPGRITLSSDLRVMAEAVGSGVIRLYNTSTKEVSDLMVGKAPLFEMALSPDGRQLITGGMGQPSSWWDLTSRTNVVFGTGMRRALFSPEGKCVLVLNGTARPELWDVATRSLRVVLSAQSSLGPAAAFSPDGKEVAIASDPLVAEQMIGVWDIKTGRYLGACIGHKQGIGGLAFSADGRTLASTSHDSTLKLWNTATLQQLLNFSIPVGLSNPCFSPDGTLLAVEQSFSVQQRGIRLYSAHQPAVSDLTARINATP